MPFFLWKPSYELGVPEIDEDHRILVGMINQLYDAIKNEHGSLALENTFDYLYDYVRKHFDTEEGFMRACRYPHLEDHLKSHRDFQDALIEMDLSRRRGSTPTATDLLTFLSKWMCDHVTTVDKDLGIYLKRYKA